eukprot:gene912-1201_t
MESIAKSVKSSTFIYDSYCCVNRSPVESSTFQRTIQDAKAVHVATNVHYQRQRRFCLLQHILGNGLTDVKLAASVNGSSYLLLGNGKMTAVDVSRLPKQS